jgi:hypothetical protein
LYPFIDIAYAAGEKAVKSKGIPVPMVVMTIIILIPVAIFILTKLKSGIDDKYGADETKTDKTKPNTPAESS